MSVLSYFNMGSSLSLRGVCRLGSTVSIANHIQFANSNKDTYVHYSSTNAQLEVYVQAQRGISINTYNSVGGGILHGVWYSDDLVHTSDRNLKKNIRPLAEILRDGAAAARTNAGGGLHNTQDGKSLDTAAWVLRELRPVSYQFKKDVEAKAAHRFGFIADEVSELIPQVVRDLPTKHDGIQHQGIVYQDLIAVLAAAIQSLQHNLERHEQIITALLARSNAAEVQSQTAWQRSVNQRLDDMQAMQARINSKLGAAEV
jgi:hypothetical protein